MAEGDWQYEVDPYGNVTKLTNPNNAVTQYAYDKLNRKVATQDALGNRLATQYDAVGNLIESHVEAAGTGARSSVPNRPKNLGAVN